MKINSYFQQRKIEKEHLTRFLRVFPKVMRDQNLSLIQKLVLSDVISRQVKGEPYIKTAKAFALETGYDKKTISDAHQWLNDNGYTNTAPYNDGLNNHSLREVE